MIMPELHSTDEKQLIFYGAGGYARENIDRLVKSGLVPACFVDADCSKHYKRIDFDGALAEAVILPLDEAVKKYPKYEIVLTVTRPSFLKVQNDLIECGIPEERIKPPVYYELTGISDISATYCRDLGTLFVIDADGIKTCCTCHGFNFKGSGSIEHDVALYKHLCSNVQRYLSDGKITTCSGCYLLENKPINKEKEIKSLILASGIYGGDKCNLNCIYCGFAGHLNKRTENSGLYDVLEILKYFSKEHSPEYVYYACGEISISPYRKEIIDLWNTHHWRGEIVTNALVYMEEIECLLKEGLIAVKPSLDSGTAKTYKRIKGVDCFNRVVENIKKYAVREEAVLLKYLLLDDINTNETDLNGFMDIAEEIKALVVITKDNTYKEIPMTEKEHSSLMKIVEKCRAVGLRWRLETEWFIEDIDRLKSDGVIKGGR